MSADEMHHCKCGAEMPAHRVRCIACSDARALMMQRRRELAKRVPPEHLEGALALLEAQAEALEQKRERLKQQYEGMRRRQPHAWGTRRE